MPIPILAVRDLPEAIAFYTRVLDFAVTFSWPEEQPCHAGLRRGADELHLNLAREGGRHGRSSTIILCEDVDAVFADFVARGFRPPVRPESPVHEGPLEQTWGCREVYIDDPSGNTLVFQQRR